MDQRSTWGNAVNVNKKKKLPYRGIQKENDNMSESERNGISIWNEMVRRLIEVGEMEKK